MKPDTPPSIPTPSHYHLDYTEETRNPTLTCKFLSSPGPYKEPTRGAAAAGIWGFYGASAQVPKCVALLPRSALNRTPSTSQWNRAQTHPLRDVSPNTASKPGTHLSPLM